MNIETPKLKRILGFVKEVKEVFEFKNKIGNELTEIEVSEVNSLIPFRTTRVYIENLWLSSMAIDFSLYITFKDLFVPYNSESATGLAKLSQNMKFTLRNVAMNLQENNSFNLTGIDGIMECLNEFYIENVTEQITGVLGRLIINKLPIAQNNNSKKLKPVRSMRMYNPYYPLQRYSKTSSYYSEMLLDNNLGYYVCHLTDKESCWILSTEWFVCLINNKLMKYNYNDIILNSKDLILTIKTSEKSGLFKFGFNNSQTETTLKLNKKEVNTSVAEAFIHHASSFFFVN